MIGGDIAAIDGKPESSRTYVEHKSSEGITKSGSWLVAASI
jgi:hypothetical protein